MQYASLAAIVVFPLTAKLMYAVCPPPVVVLFAWADMMIIAEFPVVKVTLAGVSRST